MGRTRSTCGGSEIHTGLVGKLEGQNPLENLGLDGRVILKCALKK